MSYAPPHLVLDVTWSGSTAYAPADTTRDGWVGGVSSGENLNRALRPVGVPTYAIPLPKLYEWWEYPPPNLVVDGNWGGAPTYTPTDTVRDALWTYPASDSTVFFVTVGEATEFGSPACVYTQSVGAAGFYDGLVAEPFVEEVFLQDASWVGSSVYHPEHLLLYGWWAGIPSGTHFTIGWGSSRVGAPSVRNELSYIYASGELHFAAGTAAVANSSAQLLPGGIAPPPQTGPNGDRQIPNPFIDFRIRYLTPGGIAVPTNQIATTHVITFDIQFIDLAGRGPNPWVTGNARIEYAVRYVEPFFITSNVFGSHNVARIQVVSPTGWGSSFISENHEFDINLQRVFHHSGVADPTGHGATHIRNQFEVLRPSGWLSQNINFPIVYNLDQYLSVQPYMGTNSDPTQWPPYSPFVENKTRTLIPGGWRSSRFSVIGNIVENAADPVLPVGLDSLVFGAGTFISHYTRYVGPEGWDSFYNSRYTVVYNDADVLGALGWTSSAFGRPESVRNLNRDVKQFFPYGGESVGLAFIAYAVRIVTPGLFYDVPSGFPEVRLNPYPIATAGIAPPQFGAIYVDERFSIVSPKSANVHPVEWVGEPIVENKNKTLAVFPSDQFFPGIPKIANYVQYYEIGGGNLIVFGAHLIAYRTKTIAPTPAVSPAIVITHRIRNLIPDPPGPQKVFPGGIDFPILARPTLSTRTISVSSIADDFIAGTATVTTNNLRPLSIYDDGMIGVPAIPVPRPIYPLPIPADGFYFLAQVPSGIRMSPFNIYAPFGDQKPPGYTPTNNGGPIDSMAVFGRSEVSHFHRVIGPVPDHASSRINRPTAWGDAELHNRRRVVAPYGLMSLRFSVPIFWGVPQRVEMGGEFGQPGIASTNDFGAHVVARYIAPEVDRTLFTSGLSAAAYGFARVELFHRTLQLTGIPHRGNPQQELTNPWGQTLVGYPRRYVISAGETTLWGATVIEYKNRTVTASGFSVNTLDDDDIEERIAPMRVIRRNPPGGVPSIGSALVFGVADVSHYERTVFARGPHGFVSGTPRVRAAVTVEPPGWDSFVAGDIDEWEAGKIKPYGDDVSTLGTPRIDRRLYVFSAVISGAQLGAARMANVIRASGLPEIGFAGPSLTDIYGCSNRIVAPAPILSVEMFGSPQGEIA